MGDPSPVQAAARPLAVARRVRVRSTRWTVVRPYLNAVSALSALLFLMSAADLDTPVPYLCGAAALLAALGADLAT